VILGESAVIESTFILKRGLHRYRWRAEYEGVNLSHEGEGGGGGGETWRALAEPLEVFNFDFTDIDTLQAAACHLDFQLTAGGIFNAVAFWFDLKVDENETLSTSPYGEKGQTWQQVLPLAYFIKPVL
jgi:hypothetical protein